MPNQSPQQPTPSSFIPRDTVQTTRTRRNKTRGLLDLLILFAMVVFVASGAFGAGMFLYHQFLQTSATSKVDQLERASAAFEPTLIQELSRLDDRMRAAQEVLGGHIAPTAFFRMLEQTTIQTVAFRSLTFEASDPQRITIRMDGIADSVNSIALQADLFSKAGMVASPIFSNIDRRPEGVFFNVSALINSSGLNYGSLVRGALQGTSQNVIVPPAPSPSPASPFESANPEGETAPAPLEEREP